MMRSESSNYRLGRLDKVLVLKFVLTQTDRPTNPDTEFKMVRGRTIKISALCTSVEFYWPSKVGVRLLAVQSILKADHEAVTHPITNQVFDH